MNVIKKLSIFIVLALLPVATSARMIQVIYKGTIVSGSDNNNFFGLGVSLVGASYTSSYLFDDSKGVRTTISPYLDSIIGGPFNGTSDPSLGAFLTINGRSFSFTGSSLGLHSVYPLGTAISSYASDQSDNPFDASYLGNSLQVVTLPSSMETSFSASGSPAVSGFTNGFQIATGPSIYIATYAYGVLAPSNVTVVVTSMIPEPKSWTFMILGLGVVGMMLRRPRRTGRAL